MYFYLFHEKFIRSELPLIILLRFSTIMVVPQTFSPKTRIAIKSEKMSKFFIFSPQCGRRILILVEMSLKPTTAMSTVLTPLATTTASLGEKS